MDATGRGEQHVRRRTPGAVSVSVPVVSACTHLILGLGDQRGRNVMAEPEDHVDAGNTPRRPRRGAQYGIDGRKTLRQQRAILRPPSHRK
jgi:hypothetical protein